MTLAFTLSFLRRWCIYSQCSLVAKSETMSALREQWPIDLKKVKSNTAIQSLYIRVKLPKEKSHAEDLRGAIHKHNPITCICKGNFYGGKNKLENICKGALSEGICQNHLAAKAMCLIITCLYKKEVSLKMNTNLNKIRTRYHL